MARKKKKTVSEIPVEVSVAAVTVTNVDSSCVCGHVFQKQLCELNLQLGVERLCAEEEDPFVSSGAEASAVATGLEEVTETEAEIETKAATVTEWEDICCEVYRELSVDRRWAHYCLELKDTPEELGRKAEDFADDTGSEAEAVTEAAAAAEGDSCCEVFRKLNIGLRLAYESLEHKVQEDLEEEVGAATGEAAVAEAAVVRGSEDSCHCRNDLEKFWCDEYLKLGMERRCVELRKLLENKNSGENSGTVNHFKIIWHKDSVL